MTHCATRCYCIRPRKRHDGWRCVTCGERVTIREGYIIVPSGRYNQQINPMTVGRTLKFEAENLRDNHDAHGSYERIMWGVAAIEHLSTELLATRSALTAQAEARPKQATPPEDV